MNISNTNEAVVAVLQFASACAIFPLAKITFDLGKLVKTIEHHEKRLDRIEEGRGKDLET